MDKIPPNTDELADFILDVVLHGIDLDPVESQRILSYMNERHEHLFGPHATYFLLGSYEPPFKYRLDDALDVLNHRHNAYAYLLTTQPDLDVSNRIPDLKVKFYLHALYANAIPLVLEHNTGGALAEFGRLDRPSLFDRTYVFPRAHEERYADDDVLTTTDAIRARAVELAYNADDLDEALARLADRAADRDMPVTKSDLHHYLDGEFGRRDPSYSGVLTDGFSHFDAVDRCFSWTTVDELESALSNVP